MIQSELKQIRSLEKIVLANLVDSFKNQSKELSEEHAKLVEKALCANKVGCFFNIYII